MYNWTTFCCDDYTTLPVDNHLIFRKKSFRPIMTMTLTNEFKILDYKIKTNQAQYDLDQEAANFSALSSRKKEKKWILDWWKFSIQTESSWKS